ncbi:MAG: hypothetical protein KF774_12505 [Planctomyces sp.]|nr:hypothetical protein [Planctomyces sp.]
MLRTLDRKRLWSAALGGVCLAGLGIQGCSRNAVDLGREDAQARSAAEERAAAAVQRSKQDLLAQEERTRKSATGKGEANERLASVSTQPEVITASAEKPSRFGNGWKGLTRTEGGLALFRKKPAPKDKDGGDPFLQSDAKDSSVAANKSVDEFLQEQRPVAIDRRTPVAANPSTKAEPQAESREPLADPLLARSQQRVVVKPSPGAEEPKTAPAGRPQKSDKDRLLEELLAEMDAGAPSAPPAKSKARPFPPMESPETDEESALLAAVPPKRSSSNPLAEKPPVAQRAAQPAPAEHPLIETETQADFEPEPVELASADRRSPASRRGAVDDVGRQISKLLDNAREAADNDDYPQALQLAAEAQRIAARSSYEFPPGTEQPIELVGRLAEEMASRPATEEPRSAVATTNDAARPPFSKVAWSRPEEQLRDIDAFGAKPSASEPAIARMPDQRQRAGGRRRNDPQWPAITSVAFEQSDELWQSAEPDVAELDSGTSSGDVGRDVAFASNVTRAAAEAAGEALGEEAPPFVPAGNAGFGIVAAREFPTLERGLVEPEPWSPRDTPAVAPPPPLEGPFVELGMPTPISPDETIVAAASRRTSRKPLTPPALSIDGGFDDAATLEEGGRKARRVTGGRTGWYVIFGFIVIVGTALFRRKFYAAPRPVEEH